MMNRIRFLGRNLVAWSVFCLVGLKPACAQSAVADFTKWIDRDAVAILRVDVERMLQIVSPEWVQQFAQQAGFQANHVESAAMIAEHVRRIGQEFSDAGGQEVWCVLSLADVPQGSPLIIVRGKGDSEAVKMTAWLKQQCESPAASGLEVTEHDRKTWLVAHATTLQRVRNQIPDERPELAAALTAIEGRPAAALFHLSSDQRRVLRQTFPTLPEPWRNVNGELLADGILWSVATLDPQSEVMVRIAIETRDAGDAKRVSDAIQTGFQFVSQMPKLQEQLPQANLLLKRIQPQVVDRQVQILLRKEALQASLLQLISQPLTAARQSAKRQQCMNNLKQIGLAMHMYHDQHTMFPPAASRDDQGRPLLSWRVHLLPQLGAQSLYDQFHLDEPWDSDHNRKLVTQIPQVFVCPENAGIENGKTTYVLPIGKGTMWGGDQPLSFREITDGTSQTVMVIEAGKDKAVEWTRPEDLTVRSDSPTEGWGCEHGAGTLALFCDGSGRFLSGDLPAKTVWALLGANDGQAVTE